MKKQITILIALLFMALSAFAQWSDNFNGGAQQTWGNLDGGESSTAIFQNDRYELTTGTTGVDKYFVSYVDQSSDNYIMQGQIKRISESDNFLTYLVARANPGTLSGYVCGASSAGTHLWFAKLTGGVYSNLASTGPTLNYDPSDYQIRFAVFGNTLAAKVWSTSGTEPTDWQLTFTDNSYSDGAGGIMLATYTTLGWNTVQAAFDDVSLSVLSKSTVWVDDNWAGSTAGKEVEAGKIFGYNAFATINTGISAVNPGGTIEIGEGTYTEALTVGKSLTFIGSGPASNPTTIITSSGSRIIQLTATDNSFSFQNLIVEGVTTNNGIYAGSTIDINSLTMQDVIVRNCQVGLYLSEKYPNTTTVNDLIMDNVTLTNNKFIGAYIGKTVLSGTVTDCTVTDNGYSDELPASWQKTGLQFVNFDEASVPQVTVTNSNFSNNGAGASNIERTGLIIYTAYNGTSTNDIMTVSGCTFENHPLYAVRIKNGYNLENTATVNGTFTNNYLDIWFNNIIGSTSSTTLVRNTFTGIRTVGAGPTYDYSSIQSAIDAATAGDEIQVSAGIYNETVTLNKSLKLQGAGASSTIVDGDGLGEAILVHIPNPLGDITIDGFTFKNATNYQIVVTGGENENALIAFTNNVIIGRGTADGGSDYGLYGANFGKSKILFNNNEVSKCTFHGFFLERWLGESELSYNTFSESSRPIGFMTYETLAEEAGIGDVTSNQYVHNNIIDLTGESSDRGIFFIAPYGIGYNDIYSGGRYKGGKFTDVEIKNNSILNVSATGVGIQLEVDGDYGGIFDAIIEGNTITSENNHEGKGIRILASAKNTIIQNNEFTELEVAVWQSYSWGQPGAIGPTGNKVYNNSFNDCSYGVNNQYTDNLNIIDATYNYWGQNGPIGLVSANVDYSPWWGDATGSYLIWLASDDDELAAALEDAEDGDILYLSGGTYAPIEITKSITISGATGDRDETVFDGEGIGTVVTITSDNVVFENCTVKNSGSNADDAGILLDKVIGCTIKNNNLINNLGTGIRLLASSTNSITLNSIYNNDVGMKFEGISGTPCSGNTVEDNKIYNNTTNGVEGNHEFQTEEVVVEKNWWGNPAGPTPPGGRYGNGVTTNVDYDPWWINEGMTILSEDVDVYVDAPKTLIKDEELQTYSVKVSEIYALRTFEVELQYLKADFGAAANFAIGTAFTTAGLISTIEVVDNSDDTYWNYVVTGGFLGVPVAPANVSGEDVDLFTFDITSLLNASNLTGSTIDLVDVLFYDNNNPYAMIPYGSLTDKDIIIDSGEPTMTHDNADDYPSPYTLQTGVLPALNFTFNDNYNLDDVQYLVQAEGIAAPTLPGDFTGNYIVENFDGTEESVLGWFFTQVELDALADGTYTIYYLVLDDAGNYSIYDWDFIKDTTPPDAITWVSCLTTPDANNSIDLEWENPADAVKNHIWALSYAARPDASGYPEYSPATGDVPVAPDPNAASPQNGWTFIEVINAATEYTWTGMARGYYYFYVFVEDISGNIGDAPSSYVESISYWPGDVNETPNGLVNGDDIALLSAVWGLGNGQIGWNDIIDVGPTVDNGRRSLPTPDGVINIEDLMIFAMNYGNTDYDYYPRVDDEDITPIQIDMICYHQGSLMSIDIVLIGNENLLKGVNIPLYYGNGYQLESLETGGIWPEGTIMLHTNSNGIVELSITALGSEAVVEGDGIIATLVFEVIGNSVTELRHMTARTPNNQEIEIIDNPITGETADTIIPVTNILANNYPNPFNPTTTIKYGLMADGKVSIIMYNIKGQKVKTLVNESQKAGHHTIVWDGKDDYGKQVASGVYFYRMITDKFSETKKALLLK